MMTNYCAHCGRILPENAAFCPACGTPVIEAASNHQEPKEPETFFERFKADYWGAKGRLCRKAYLLRSLSVFALSFLFVALYMAGQFYFAKTLQEASGPLFIVLFMMVNSLVMMALFIMPQMILLMLAIRRAHDLGKSGEIVAFIWVPFYGLYVAFMLCAEKGTEGENRYGPDPLAEEGVHS